MTIKNVALLASFCLMLNLRADYKDVFQALGTVADSDYKNALLKATYLQIPSGDKNAAILNYLGKSGAAFASAKAKGEAAKTFRSNIDAMIPADQNAVKTLFVALMTTGPGGQLVAAFPGAAFTAPK